MITATFEKTSPWRDLLSSPEAGQRQAGYYHTVREILQQPATWLDTAARAVGARPEIESVLKGCRAVALTGSGSSEYAGRCLALPLQEALGVPVEVAPGGRLLAMGARALSPLRPLLLVSLARSGDSPESMAAVRQLEADAGIRHLVLTCNSGGSLARSGHPILVLDPRTNDRSLVMTSSFTNMVLAGMHIGCRRDSEDVARRLAAAAEDLLLNHAGTLADIARRPFRKAVYLGTGANEGAARESALKMLEMTGGRIYTLAESFLGLRHGPMSLVDSATLVVGLLSSDRHVRAYECDLIDELRRKGLGGEFVLAGEDVPGDLGTAIPIGAAAPITLVLVGQLLALFRCLAEGLQPDAPSASGVITRVVNAFRIYERPE